MDTNTNQDENNMIGRKFNRLTVLRKDEFCKTKLTKWICRCNCGNEVSVQGTNLKSGHTKSCGCIKNETKYGKFRDLTGERFGKLLVVERLPSKRLNNGNMSSVWKCRCDCGKECTVLTTYLTSGKKQSCGCNQYKTPKTYIDLCGQKFGKLLVVKRVEDYVQSNGRKRTRYLCKCDCGKECVVSKDSLRSGSTKTCGCERYKMVSDKTSYDLTNQRFGRLVAVQKDGYYISPSGHKEIKWKCLCDCGKEVSIQVGSLLSGDTKSCGCLKRDLCAEQRLDVTGEKYGKLTAMYYAGDINGSEKYSAIWHFKCDCGNEKDISLYRVRSGQTVSCGCTKSKGEYDIINFLNDNKIDYEYQKTYPDLRGIRGGLLSYDFYLPTYNLLVEYQGEQHYRSVEIWGGEDMFAVQKEHDKRKREYAKANSIDLLEIPYSSYKNASIVLQQKLQID